jgi:hypothetical protein
MKRGAIILLVLLCFGCEFNIFRKVVKPGEDAMTLVFEGERCIAEGDYSCALENFTRALEQNPALSRARAGRVKARFGLQVGIPRIVQFCEKLRGRVYSDPERELAPGEPIIQPSDFNFSATTEGFRAFLNFAKNNFVDLHQIIWGYSDEEIPRNDPSVNLDFSAIAILTAVLNVQWDYPSFNAFWNDTLHGYYMNLALLEIPSDAPCLAEMQLYLELANYAVQNAIENSAAHDKTWMYEYKDIICRLIQEVKFYRSL